MSASISQSESQRYDRQIRVWGAEAQARIQRSKVLICGLKKLNVEARKFLFMLFRSNYLVCMLIVLC